MLKKQGPQVLNMHCLNGRIIIMFSTLVVIKSEQWFSAAVFPTGPLESQKYSTSDIPIQQTHYQILPVIKDDNKTQNALKWYFSKNQNILKKQPSLLDESTTETILEQESITNSVKFMPQSLFEYTNLNPNDLKTLRPKRKVPRCPTLQPKQWKQHVNQTKKSKFLEVFEVVQFEHVACTSSSGLQGKCLHEYECHSAGGATMGTCADGYGACCVIQFACDGSYSSPTGWITNPGYPSPSSERISCSVTLEKSSPDIKQIRLDFLHFEMLPPTSGTCEEDQFVTSGQNANNIIPILCGINTGQHVYIEIGDSVGPLTLSVQTVTTANRLYAIKGTQLSGSDDLAAPTGCLQHYKDANGYLQSFNYQDNSDIGIPRYPSYFNNLNYAICIERASTFCSITYTNAGDMQIPNYDTDGLPVIPPRQAGVEIFNCPSDWLLISAVRLCGERLNDGSVLQDFSLDAPVTDNGAGPIVLWFRSDGGYVGRGFKLHYLQNACMVER